MVRVFYKKSPYIIRRIQVVDLINLFACFIIKNGHKLRVIKLLYKFSLYLQTTRIMYINNVLLDYLWLFLKVMVIRKFAIVHTKVKSVYGYFWGYFNWNWRQLLHNYSRYNARVGKLFIQRGKDWFMRRYSIYNNSKFNLSIFFGLDLFSLDFKNYYLDFYPYFYFIFENNLDGINIDFLSFCNFEIFIDKKFNNSIQTGNEKNSLVYYDRIRQLYKQFSSYFIDSIITVNSNNIKYKLNFLHFLRISELSNAEAYITSNKNLWSMIELKELEYLEFFNKRKNLNITLPNLKGFSKYSWKKKSLYLVLKHGLKWFNYKKLLLLIILSTSFNNLFWENFKIYKNEFFFFLKKIKFSLEEIGDGFLGFIFSYFSSKYNNLHFVRSNKKLVNLLIKKPVLSLFCSNISLVNKKSINLKLFELNTFFTEFKMITLKNYFNVFYKNLPKFILNNINFINLKLNKIWLKKLKNLLNLFFGYDMKIKNFIKLIKKDQYFLLNMDLKFWTNYQKKIFTFLEIRNNYIDSLLPKLKEVFSFKKFNAIFSDTFFEISFLNILTQKWNKILRLRGNFFWQYSKLAKVSSLIYLQEALEFLVPTVAKQSASLWGAKFVVPAPPIFLKNIQIGLRWLVRSVFRPRYPGGFARLLCTEVLEILLYRIYSEVTVLGQFSLLNLKRRIFFTKSKVLWKLRWSTMYGYLAYNKSMVNIENIFKKLKKEKGDLYFDKIRSILGVYGRRKFSRYRKIKGNDPFVYWKSKYTHKKKNIDPNLLERLQNKYKVDLLGNNLNYIKNWYIENPKNLKERGTFFRDKIGLIPNNFKPEKSAESEKMKFGIVKGPKKETKGIMLSESSSRAIFERLRFYLSFKESLVRSRPVRMRKSIKLFLSKQHFYVRLKRYRGW